MKGDGVSFRVNSELMGRVLSWARGVPAPPFRIMYMITDHCNLDCPGCGYTDFTKGYHRAEIPPGRALQLVDESARLGARHWILGGAEVFVRKTTALALMRRIKHHGLYGEITTNGMLLRPDEWREIAAMRWDVLTLSLDGATPAVNDALRGPGCFDAVMAALEVLAAATDGFATGVPYVTINTTLYRQNAHELAGMARLLAAHRVAEWNVQPARRLSAAFDRLSVLPAQYPMIAALAAEGAAICEAAGMLHNLAMAGSAEAIELNTSADLGVILRRDTSAVRHPLLGSACFEPYLLMTVFPDGTVSPCWMHRAGDTANVMARSLAAIWQGPEFTAERRLFGAGGIPAYCENCCFNQLLTSRVIRAQVLEAVGNHQAALEQANTGLSYAPKDAEMAAVKWLALRGLGRATEAAGFAAQSRPRGAPVAGQAPPDLTGAQALHHELARRRLTFLADLMAPGIAEAHDG